MPGQAKAAKAYGVTNITKLKAKVQIAKKQLDMHDDDYRAMLKEVTGETSTKQMTAPQLDKVLKRMKALGFEEINPSSAKLHTRQENKILSLWSELNKSGLVKNPNKQALNAYVKRQTGIDQLEWLNSLQASRVIEALKNWQGRRPSN